jgi:hypothetical protein
MSSFSTLSAKTDHSVAVKTKERADEVLCIARCDHLVGPE